MRKRVVVTGLGVIATNGKGRQEFWQALKDGKVGYRPITLFDTAEFLVKVAGEVPDFDAKVYMGQKGLRLLDRSTRLMICAGKLAVDDSGLVITDENSDDMGVSVGCTLGSLKSIAEFDEITLTEGPRYVNPALFPNTVINSPASQVSIWSNIQGFNTTIATGFTASLDAMNYAFDFIQDERAKVVLAGGVEELCYHTFFGFHTLKFISGATEGQTFVNCPFDKRRNGVTFGEGAGLIVMEDIDFAKARNAKIIGEVMGFGTSFDPFSSHKYNPRGDGLKRAIQMALEDSGMKADDIDFICANANSHPRGDKMETQVIKEIFGPRAYKIPVSAVKSMVGECYSMSGTYQAMAALAAINENFLPPTVGYEVKDPDCDLDYVPNVSRPTKVNNVLINSFGPNGSNTCMILKRYQS